MVVILGAEFLNETAGEVVSGCLDHQLQRTVPIGEWYHTHNCEICLCSPTQRMCKQVPSPLPCPFPRLGMSLEPPQVYCAPPESCDGYLQRDPNLCCDICVPVTVGTVPVCSRFLWSVNWARNAERESSREGFNLRLGIGTVALFCVLSLLLFAFHRLRKKRSLHRSHTLPPLPSFIKKRRGPDRVPPAASE